MLPWSEISLYPHYADVDLIGSEFGSSKTGLLPTLPGKRWPNYGSCFLGSSSPIEVMCRGPSALRTCQLEIFFVRIPQMKSVRRQATRNSSDEECNWEGIVRHTSPNVWAGVHQLLSEAERVRQKPGSSFKRRYCFISFNVLKYSYGIRKLQHHLCLLNK